MTTSIRVKTWAVLGLLILLASILAAAGLYAVRLSQQQARDVSWRVNVLPAAGKLSRNVSGLQAMHSELKGIMSVTPRPSEFFPIDSRVRAYQETQFAQTLSGLKNSYEDYQQLLEDRVQKIGIKGSFAQEFSTVNDIRSAIQELDEIIQKTSWSERSTSLDLVQIQLQLLQKHTEQLPAYLADELEGYSETMRKASGWLYMTVILCVIVSVGLMGLLLWLSYVWIFKPLRILIAGSRQVAGGKYGYRIALPAQDEIGELAQSMNLMTERFEEKVQQLEESRRDLDDKVKQRSRELVQSERLASVGFLAAGVAHEINNPLMAISACAESLQRRIESVFAKNESKPDEIDYVKRYLTMIQEEAFRCKGITERLLGLVRNETKEWTKTNFVPIITDMLEMIRQQSSFKQKNVTLDLPESLEITINAQEMKQVILNLLTNAFQNTEEYGNVHIRLIAQENTAVLTVQDDGMGMDSEVLQNIFEPFFTRRNGGSGTGLGLSITHRIIEEHQGRISVFSEGTGKGSIFTVELPYYRLLADLAERGRN